MPEFPTVRRMTLGMNSPLGGSLHNGEDDDGRETQRHFHGWLGSPVHRLHGGSLLPHQREEGKFVDDASEKE